MYVLAGYAQPIASPVISFTLDFPISDPGHYVITVASDGHASYESNGRLTPKSAGEEEPTDPDPPSRLEFTASPEFRTRIFELAKKVNYFQRQLETKKRNLAFTGSKTLTYNDAQRDSKATYNYSPIAEVQELTQIFQNVSTTLEFGRRLEYYHHYQKLALSDELKRMEELAKSNDLEELAAVAPILQKIVDDNSVINVVRARAQRLLIRAAAN